MFFYNTWVCFLQKKDRIATILIFCGIIVVAKIILILDQSNSMYVTAILVEIDDKYFHENQMRRKVLSIENWQKMILTTMIDLIYKFILSNEWKQMWCFRIAPDRHFGSIRICLINLAIYLSNSHCLKEFKVLSIYSFLML